MCDVSVTPTLRDDILLTARLDQQQKQRSDYQVMQSATERAHRL